MRDGKAGGQSQHLVMLGTAGETPAMAEGSREARTQQMHAACQVLAPTPYSCSPAPVKPSPMKKGHQDPLQQHGSPHEKRLNASSPSPYTLFRAVTTHGSPPPPLPLHQD